MTEIPTPSHDADEDRRKFLATCGKFPVVTPPAITLPYPRRCIVPRLFPVIQLAEALGFAEVVEFAQAAASGAGVRVLESSTKNRNKAALVAAFFRFLVELSRTLTPAQICRRLCEFHRFGESQSFR